MDDYAARPFMQKAKQPFNLKHHPGVQSGAALVTAMPGWQVQFTTTPWVVSSTQENDLWKLTQKLITLVFAC
jgi:hypothetical protein